MTNDNDSKVVSFPITAPTVQAEPDRPRYLRALDIELIGFIATDDGEYWIEDPADIAKIIAFIRSSGILISTNE